MNLRLQKIFNMRSFCFLAFCFSLLTTGNSCNESGDHASKENLESASETSLTASQSNHVSKGNSGIYYLAPEGQGRSMKLDRGEEYYTISQQAFVPAENILRASARLNIIEGQTTYGLTLVLDNVGTEKLAKGMSDPTHAQMAIVVANKLLYVVEINHESPISTGILNIVLVNYSQAEVDAMLKDLNGK